MAFPDLPENIFTGYLIYYTYYNSNHVLVHVPFPHEYIAYGSYKTTPNQREEIRAYRDENTRNLTRVTAAGRKSIFSFETRNHLHLKDKQAIQRFFRECEERTAKDDAEIQLNRDQRRMKLFFWNEEENRYNSGWFYLANEEYPIEQVSTYLPEFPYDGGDIIYQVMKFSFVEY